MNPYKIILVAFQQFENLGMGYLASVLIEAGYNPLIIDFRTGKEEILKELKRNNPVIVGFSVIFLYHIFEFKALIEYLRANEIKCHFTAGGHYASLRYEELFSLIPSLDSVVRFEGEYTFRELAKMLDAGTDWRKIRGIAFKQDGETIVNTLRPLEKDLDKFPFPERAPLKEYIFGKKFATILAGRGCIHDCIYCDIREFYKTPDGPVKRLRNPEKVIEEIQFLHNEKNCSVFLFQDDDFPVKTEKGDKWVEIFCEGLKFKNPDDKIMWKINCRPDEVEYDRFKTMKDHGLYLVFLGIEDGTNNGLIRLNKKMTVEKSIEGINILKKLDIGFDYGFMLFQPWSDFSGVKENLNFLEKICNDGFTPVTWLKMLPFFETKIERELRKAGRIKEEPGFLDYDFHDSALNQYYEFTTDCFSEWLLKSDGLLNTIRWARNYISVFSQYYQITPDIIKLKNEIRQISSKSNIFILETMKELATLFEEGKFNKADHHDFKQYKTRVKTYHDSYKEQTRTCISGIVNIAALQELSQSILI